MLLYYTILYYAILQLYFTLLYYSILLYCSVLYYTLLYSVLSPRCRRPPQRPWRLLCASHAEASPCRLLRTTRTPRQRPIQLPVHGGRTSPLGWAAPMCRGAVGWKGWHRFLYYLMLYSVMLYYAILCYTMLYYAILCYTMLYYAILYYVMPYYTILY